MAPAGVTGPVQYGPNVAAAYSYDTLNRRTKASVGTTTGPTLATWTYDTATNGKGLLASTIRTVDNANYTVSVGGYHDRGRPLSKTTSVAWNPAPPPTTPETQTYTSYQHTFGYDLADHLTSVSYPPAGGLSAETVTTSYNPFGYPTATTGTATYLKDTLFTGEGRPTQRSFRGDGSVVRTMLYGDVAKRLTTLQTKVGTTVLEDNEYTWDADSNLTQVRDVASRDGNFAITSVAQNECFGYDGLARLTRAYTNAGTATCANPLSTAGTAPYDLTYSFGTTNDTGNLLSVTDAGTTTTYGYPASGSGSLRPHTVTTVNGANTYVYDDNGALTSRPGQSLEWDELHKLKTITAGSTTTGNIYDADGNRLLRTVTTGSTVTKTLYLDGMEITATNGAVDGATRYYGNYATRTIAALYWTFANPQGSVTVSLPDGSSTGTRRRYLPYGGQRAAVSLPTERGFLGKTLDTTGLHSVGARFYDAALGRFVNTDPLMNPSSVASLNPYTYADNNPTTLSDPSGLKPDPGINDCPARDCTTPIAGTPSSSTPTPQPTPTPDARPNSAPTSPYAVHQICNLPSMGGPGTCTWVVTDTTQDPFFAMLAGLARHMLGTYERNHPLEALAVREGVRSTQRTWSHTRGCFNGSIGACGALWLDLFSAGMALAPVFAEWAAVRAAAAEARAAAAEAQAALAEARAATAAAGRGEAAYHYTQSRHVAAIQSKGLWPGTYATPNGGLSPLQAQIDLALKPNRGLPDAIIRIDLAGLRAAGYDIPPITQVGRSFNMPGGGYEMQFPYRIPSEYLKVIWP